MTSLSLGDAEVRAGPRDRPDRAVAERDRAGCPGRPTRHGPILYDGTAPAPSSDGRLDRSPAGWGYRSSTRAVAGRLQQTSASSGGGVSRGGTTYSTSPDTTGVMHVWHTPVRHAHRVRTSHASASSSNDPWGGAHSTDRPLRAKVTGNVGSPGVTGTGPGGCGWTAGAATTPGLTASRARNSSTWNRSGGTPRSVKSACMSRMNGSGPQTYTSASEGRWRSPSAWRLIRPDRTS